MASRDAWADIMTGNSRVFAIIPDGGLDAWINHDTNTGFVNTKISRDLVDNGGFTTPVGTLLTGVSHYGCYDMAGNADICRALRAMTASASRAVLPPTMS